MDNVQNSLSRDALNEELRANEPEAITQLKYWHNIEKSVLFQKSRIKWLKFYDANSGFLHASIKARQSGNRITSLMSNTGVVWAFDSDIKEQVLSFYKTLLGSCQEFLVGVDRNIIMLEIC